jgi:hypothetical protein
MLTKVEVFFELCNKIYQQFKEKQKTSIIVSTLPNCKSKAIRFKEYFPEHSRHIIIFY